MKNVHTIDSQTVILHQQQNFVTLLQVSIQKVKGKVKKGQVNESKEMKTTKNQNRNEEKQAKRQQKQRKTKQNSQLCCLATEQAKGCTKNKVSFVLPGQRNLVGFDFRVVSIVFHCVALG